MLHESGSTRILGSPTKSVKTVQNGQFLQWSKNNYSPSKAVDLGDGVSALRLTKGGLRIGI